MACLLFTTCKKDKAPIPPEIKINAVETTARTAQLDGEYIYEGDINNIYVIYGLDSELTEAETRKMNVSDKQIDVQLSELTKKTQYYYCIECVSKHSSFRTEVATFETKNLTKPEIVTYNVSDIATQEAYCGGDVTSDGGDVVTARGVCWSTSQNPTIDNNHTIDGSGTGTFKSKITGLTANTTYYVRAYATNSDGTAYGEQKIFKTLGVSKPKVTTQSVGDVSVNSAKCGGDVTDDGNAKVTVRGVCWSTSNNPTISDSHTSDGDGEGTFTSNITGLTANTTYYVRAYATNSEGTSYGEQKGFRTLAKTVEPTVETADATEVKATSAICGGNVTSDGGAEVTVRGVCWSTSLNPTISDSHTNDGTGEGNFTSSLAGLTANTTYYYRAYATNSVGTSYGEQKMFKTEALKKPTVVTSEVSDADYTTAICGGNVTDDGWAEVTARGVCWSTSPSPTINDNKTTDGNGIGEFVSNITNLQEGVTYYVRAYATNSVGTSYGEEKMFKTMSTTGILDGYEWIDLGLSSGTLWATCNIGANSPEEYGNYYAWGEIQEEYEGEHCSTYGMLMDDFSANPNYDAATANWSNLWRMPRWNDEVKELIEQCTWQWTTQNDVNGCKVVGPNGNSIFLPATGDNTVNMTDIGYGAGTAGTYYTSTSKMTNVSPSENSIDNIYTAICFDFNSDGYIPKTNQPSGSYRDRCFSIRPVTGGNLSRKPYVITNNVSVNTDFYEVTCGGYVTSDMGVEVTTRGVCWSSTSQYPTINDDHTNDGYGLGTYTSTITNLLPETTYYVRSYATNIDGDTGYGETKTFKIYSGSESGTLNGYEWVDLGLPSGVKWATCNIGALSMEDIGNEYAWGETETKSEYSAENYKLSGLEIKEFTGNPEYDAATYNWGVTWRTPTTEEYQELIDNCSFEWTEQNGRNGYMVTGPRGTNIFLPTTGGDIGCYYNSSLSPNYYPVFYIDISKYKLVWRSTSDLYEANVIRPVTGGNIIYPSVEINTITDLTSSSVKCVSIVGSDGGAEVTARGVCWSTSSYPTIDDNHTNDGSGLGTYTSNITDLVPETTYYVRSYATSSKGTGYGKQKTFKTMKDGAELEGTLNDHEWVDLGLPSGTKWATCNVGATSPEEYGDWYAWGETETKSEYTEDNCITLGLDIEDISGNEQYDVARNKWGSTWKMPTYDEFKELYDNCIWLWTMLNDKNGYMITGPNGKSIFLPAAGCSNSFYAKPGEEGVYWTSENVGKDGQNLNSASYMNMDNSDYGFFYGGLNFYDGLSVRPVTE